ncbi:hypothetical protein B0H13DRAFT_2565770 [Mycena leptocephala]|nr:hypothetical protein B0H13DRAFT_2565770 [Mycena leptocephala]
MRRAPPPPFPTTGAISMRLSYHTLDRTATQLSQKAASSVHRAAALFKRPPPSAPFYRRRLHSSLPPTCARDRPLCLPNSTTQPLTYPRARLRLSSAQSTQSPVLQLAAHLGALALIPPRSPSLLAYADRRAKPPTSITLLLGLYLHIRNSAHTTLLQCIYGVLVSIIRPTTSCCVIDEGYRRIQGFCHFFRARASPPLKQINPA